ncbi:MAG TPA: 50S ribosomal protein L25 [Candidatus Paceibacterota bacterium]
MVLTLKAEKRNKIGKLGALRKEGIFPAVFYGHKKESTPIQMNKADFVKVWKEAGESTVVSITMPEGNVDALIHDVNYDPLTGEPRHADFYVFEKGHKIEISVPIEFEGVSPAVKEKGAVLVKVLHELKIKADPTNIPHELIVDVSSLIEMGDQVLAKDIKLPTGVELEENPEEVMALVTEAKEEVEEVAAPVDFSAIEVTKKGKADEAEGAEGETEAGASPASESK